MVIGTSKGRRDDGGHHCPPRIHEKCECPLFFRPRNVGGRGRPRSLSRSLAHTRAGRLEGHSMLLKDKVAVIYGGGGVIGGAIAEACALAGARIFLAGRTRSKLEAVARRITSSGGNAEARQVDALD